MQDSNFKMTNNNKDHHQQLHLNENRESNEHVSAQMDIYHSSSEIDAFEFDAEDLPLEQGNVFDMEDTEFAFDTSWVANSNEIVNDSNRYDNNQGIEYGSHSYLNSTEQPLSDVESESLFADMELDNNKDNELFGLKDVLLQMTNESDSVANSIEKENGSTFNSIDIEPDLSMYDNINTQKTKIQAHLISNPIEKEITPIHVTKKRSNNVSVVSRNTSPVIAPVFTSNDAPPFMQPIALPGKNYLNKGPAIKNSKISCASNEKTTTAFLPHQPLVKTNNNNVISQPIPVLSTSHFPPKSPIEPVVCVSSSYTRPTKNTPIPRLNDRFINKDVCATKQIKNSTVSRLPSKPATLSSKPVLKLANPPSPEESKEARRRRIEIMLNRQRGLYQRRIRQRKLDEEASSNLNANQDKNIILSAQNTFNAMNEATTSAAVAAALNVSPSTIPDTDVAKIAFNLIHSMVQLKHNINDASKHQKITPRNPRTDKRVTNKKQNSATSIASNNIAQMKNTFISGSKSNYPISVTTDRSTDSMKLASPRDPTNHAPTIFKAKQQTSKSPILKTVVSCSDLDMQKNKQTAKANSKNTKKNKALANKSSDSKKSEHLNSVELPSGNDPESRRQRRLIRNRLSAQLHRERKREAMDSLQKEIEDRDGKIYSLEKEVAALHKKSSSLEASLIAIRKHFGNDVIDRILHSNCTQSKLISPEIVSTSGSEFSSSCSSEDDDTVSPPKSPGRDFNGTDKKRKLPIAKSFSNASVSISANSKKKKQKKSAFLLSMASCAFMGCLMIFSSPRSPSFTENDLETEFLSEPRSPIIVPSHNYQDFNGDYGADMRRRLMTVASTSAILNNHYAVNCNSCEHDKNAWVISPLEMYPSQWQIDHEHPFSTPWSVEWSHQLFDHRGLTFAPMRSRGTDLISMPDTRMLSRNERDTTETKMNRINKLRGSKMPLNSSSFVGDEPSSKNDTASKVLSPFFVTKTKNDVGDYVGDTDVLNVAPSFIFCPDAHASLSPGLLELVSAANVTLNNPTKKMEDSKTDGIHQIKKMKNQLSTSSRMQDLTKTTFDTIFKPTLRLNPSSENEFDLKKKSRKLDDLQPDESTEKALVLSNKKFSNPFDIIEDSGIAKSIMRDNDPFLSILLPASILSLEKNDILKGIKNISESTQWIELGCQIRSARIVDGVDFIGSVPPEDNNSSVFDLDDEDPV